MLAHTSARSPEGATTPYSPPDSAMVSRLGRTSPGLHHPPPSRGGGGANSDDALWRATRDSNPIPGPQRVARGRTSLGLHHPPPSRGGGGANSADALWRATRDTPRLPLSAGAQGSEDTTRPLDPALGGGGVDVGVPRVSGATSRDSLRGGLRRSERRKVPQSAQGRGGMLYPRTPSPTATSLARVQRATAPMRDAPSPGHLRSFHAP